MPWTEDFDQFTLRLERLIDAGGDRVVGLFHHTAMGRRVASRSNSTKGLVWELEADRMIRCRNYGDRAGALKAAGLRE